MNKIIFPAGGGDPLFVDDLEFAQAGIVDAFTGLLSGFSNAALDSFILSGCVISYDGITYNITAGYVCFKGEICVVDAHSVSSPLFWNLVLTYDADGNQTFADATIHDTLEIRKVKMFATDTGGAVAAASMLRVSSKLLTLLSGVNGWLTTFAFEPAFANYGAPYFDLAYRYDPLTNRVVFRGNIARTPPLTHTADVQLFTISVPAYYPSKQQEVSGVSLGADLAAGRPVTLIFKVDGTVWAKASVGNPFSSGQISFDSVSFAL